MLFTFSSNLIGAGAELVVFPNLAVTSLDAPIRIEKNAGHLDTP
jgi:hypothetical protein